MTQVGRLATAFQYISPVSTLTRLVLSHNNMFALCEVNAVSYLTRLLSLNISDNPLCLSPLLRPYVVFRMQGLHEFNGELIASHERARAHDHFAPITKVFTLAAHRVTGVTHWYHMHASACSAMT
jgi:hypothetical protein